MMDLTMDDFIPGVIDIVTAGEFMDMTEDSQIIFI
jgi:peroxiredoxin family protein